MAAECTRQTGASTAARGSARVRAFKEEEAMSGKIAVITGSGSGIGRASALALLKSGYKVVLAGRRKEALEETAKLAGNNAPNAMAVPTDVTKKDDIVALFAKEIGRAHV